ncbi:unnamed protein product [Notodromas monacha]|uniref:Uncharacterized protein n=1 Tax=Notodromas monacha TaxID=399045 RepID=A0A7R9GGR7_9CRUS|nr:unnamed protein product [Notodromas monacha]CAG0920500.1 unnamed protein product [Notodromas monacha]
MRFGADLQTRGSVTNCTDEAMNEATSVCAFSLAASQPPEQTEPVDLSVSNGASPKKTSDDAKNRSTSDSSDEDDVVVDVDVDTSNFPAAPPAICGAAGAFVSPFLSPYPSPNHGLYPLSPPGLRKFPTPAAAHPFTNPFFFPAAPLHPSYIPSYSSLFLYHSPPPTPTQQASPQVESANADTSKRRKTVRKNSEDNSVGIGMPIRKRALAISRDLDVEQGSLGRGHD